MQTRNNYHAMIAEAIAGINYPERPAQLYEPIAYTMSLGGKRLRPLLTLITCDALGGDVKAALTPAVGLELFHNFTLLHDDVMDRADVRRGKPTVHRRWNDNVAILSGDTMLTLATQHMCQVSKTVLPAVISLFNRTAIEIYEGQQWDMDFETRNDVTEPEYMEMIRLKTSVLLGCACQLGAIIAGADEEVQRAVYDVGMNLGLAFQLQDDVLDVWGDAATFGKEPGGDIMNNKKTFLLINAQRLATDDDALELRRWLADEYAMRDMKVPAVRSLYERLGLREHSRNAIAHYSTLALEALDRVDGMSDDGRQMLHDLIVELIDRQA